MGELVQAQGSITTVIGSTTDASGGIHFGPSHVTQQGTATGLTTGTQYVFLSVQNFVENFSNPGDEVTLTSEFRVVSRGNAPNLIARTTAHLTITPAGEVTAVVTHIAFRCAG